MRIGILGAGAAGLSAAYFLRGSGHEVWVHEADDCVGGLARSFRWHGFDCDLAPHRLYCDDRELLAELGKVVPLRRVRRRSRIRVAGRWLTDPLSATQLLTKLPPAHAWRLVKGYLRRPAPTDDSFESLALSQFGQGLYELFFKPYSEKLLGIPARDIAASWGRRKLRLGSPWRALRRDSRLYFRHFHYPVSGGYGAICAGLAEALRPAIRLRSRLTAIERAPHRGYLCTFSQNGTVSERFDLVISSLPITYFASLFGLPTSLRFRALRLAYLLVDRPRVGPHQWFYLADRGNVINRVAEFKNFGGDGAPSHQTALCCEVTELGSFSLDRVVGELAGLGLLRAEEILDTKTINLERAYPIYDRSYEEQLRQIGRFFADHPDIVHLGRGARFAHADVDEIFAEAKRAVAIAM